MYKKALIVGILIASLIYLGDRIKTHLNFVEKWSEMTEIWIFSEITPSINNFYKVKSRLPSGFEEFDLIDKSAQFYIDPDNLKDPFGNAYTYTLIDDRNYEIRSAGEDSKMGTWDDYVYKRSVEVSEKIPR